MYKKKVSSTSQITNSLKKYKNEKNKKRYCCIVYFTSFFIISD